MTQLASITSRFFLRRKSQIFSAMSFVVPACILNLGHPEILVPLFVGVIGAAAAVFLLPRYVKLLLKVEDGINLKLAALTPGRILRLVFHAFWVMGFVQIISTFWHTALPSPMLAMLLIAASGGFHGIAVTLAYRGYGDRTSNILLAFSLSAWLTAFALVSPYGGYVAVAATLALGWHLLAGVLSDLRAIFFPESGIGLYFGTFNPVHKTHLSIMRDAVEGRRLSKIYVHPTTVPKLHRTALASGEIALTYRDGMRVYHKTRLADPSKNYFPTGSKFYEYEVRKELLKASIRDAGLEGRVEVLDLPHIYEEDGFFGVIRHIQKQNPGVAVHGLHGSDVGGIWVRHIFDACGWIYPYPVPRRDNISATAIREGAVGYTSETVERFLAAARSGQEFQFPSGYVFHPAGDTSHQDRIRS